MIASSVAKRYAKALFDLASENKSLSKTSEEIEDLGDLLASSPDFAAFVANPLTDSERRNAVFKDMFGARSRSTTYTFLKFLESKKRVGILPEVCQAFSDLNDEAQGILRVEVISATELSSAQFNSLAKKLADQHGKEVHLTSDVDPSLIGGFRLKIGDRITDLSVAHKLNQFRQRVLNA